MELFSKRNKDIKKDLSEKEIQSMTPEQFRTYLEERNGEEFTFYSSGAMLNDNLITTKSLNNEIYKILGIR